jgi:hypothetical protein
MTSQRQSHRASAAAEANTDVANIANSNTYNLWPHFSNTDCGFEKLTLFLKGQVFETGKNVARVYRMSFFYKYNCLLPGIALRGVEFFSQLIAKMLCNVNQMLSSVRFVKNRPNSLVLLSFYLYIDPLRAGATSVLTLSFLLANGTEIRTSKSLASFQ